MFVRGFRLVIIHRLYNFWCLTHYFFLCCSYGFVISKSLNFLYSDFFAFRGHFSSWMSYTQPIYNFLYWFFFRRNILKACFLSNDFDLLKIMLTFVQDLLIYHPVVILEQLILPKLIYSLTEHINFLLLINLLFLISYYYSLIFITKTSMFIGHCIVFIQ